MCLFKFILIIQHWGAFENAQVGIQAVTNSPALRVRNYVGRVRHKLPSVHQNLPSLTPSLFFSLLLLSLYLSPSPSLLLSHSLPISISSYLNENLPCGLRTCQCKLRFVKTNKLVILHFPPPPKAEKTRPEKLRKSVIIENFPPTPTPGRVVLA